MVYSFNGKATDKDTLEVEINNRGLNYGDGVFETMKYANGRINFWEDHYFRLMANMRILRMEIPMSFSPEFLEQQLKKIVETNELNHKAARLKLLVWRKAGGYYTPESNDIDYLITVSELPSAVYELNEKGWETDLFKDYYKPKSLLSGIKTTSAALYTVAGIFKKENGLDECILMNDNKSVAEGISHNIFMVKDKEVISPPLESGCLKGVMRKKVIELLPKMGYTVSEKEFSPFEIQKADELFFTNTINGVRWVSRYRKKEFKSDCSRLLIEKINIKVALG